METLVLFCLFLLFSFTQPVLCDKSCIPASCDGVHGPIIRFPFRLIGRQPEHCGYPGFDLSCNNQNQTILSLPRSGEVVVDYIDYTQQTILITDPDRCDPKKILNFSLSDSPFEVIFTRKYTFFNCSAVGIEFISFSYDLFPLLCLSGVNYTVMATPSYSSSQQIPQFCRKIPIVSSLYVSLYWTSMELREDFQLTWNEPGCRSCEANGGICGYKGNKVLEVGCSRPPNPASGLPRSAKYGIIIGVGIPGLVCLIGLACFAFGRIRAFSHRGRSNSSELGIITISQQPVVGAAGLDGPTIASFPKTVLGESRRLPKPSDSTCPICLSEYEPKETLKSIPECNHYFHNNCIDEWLKLNGTCPVCRNSPESSIGTPCSSMSFSYSLSSSGHH